VITEMLSRPAKRRGYERNSRPGYPPPPRTTVRKFIQPPPKPKLRLAIKRQDLLDSRFGQHLSILLHVIALTSFSIIGGYAWDLLLMSGFKAGVLLGVATYAILLLASVALENKSSKEILKHNDKRVRVMSIIT
jgi:hypothetical protein